MGWGMHWINYLSFVYVSSETIDVYLKVLIWYIYCLPRVQQNLSIHTWNIQFLKIVQIKALTLLHSEWSKLHWVLAVLLCNIVYLSAETLTFSMKLIVMVVGTVMLKLLPEWLHAIVLPACNIGGGTGNNFHVSAGLSAVQHYLKNAYKDIRKFGFWLKLQN